MNKVTGCPLNILAIADSGQCFRWQKHGDFFYGVVGDQVIKIMPISHDQFYWQTHPQKNNFPLFSWYFNLDKNYQEIIGSISKDKHIYKAIKKYWGLREVRQPLFETIISYIISANNGLKLICRSIDLLSRHWGKRIKFDGLEFYSFPKSQVLDKISLKDLAAVTRIGFRAKYLKKAVKNILSGRVDLEKINKLPAERACQILQALPGVGPKVADCIALFALGHDHLVPFDVWMKRVFVQVYSQSSKAKYSDLQKFAFQYFGPFAGWAHQFLYMYSREHGIEKLKS